MQATKSKYAFKRKQPKTNFDTLYMSSNHIQLYLSDCVCHEMLQQELTEYIKQHPEQAELLVEKTGKGGKQKQIPTLPFAMPPKYDTVLREMHSSSTVV